MPRRRSRNKNRGGTGQRLRHHYATYSTGGPTDLIAKQFAIPGDRPARALSASLKLATDVGVGYVSVAVIDGNKEVCARSRQVMVTPVPSFVSFRVPPGTDFDHYSSGDTVMHLDVVFTAASKPTALHFQAEIVMEYQSSNIGVYGEPLDIAAGPGWEQL